MASDAGVFVVPALSCAAAGANASAAAMIAMPKREPALIDPPLNAMKTRCPFARAASMARNRPLFKHDVD
jgi:hypothetical protein